MAHSHSQHGHAHGHGSATRAFATQNREAVDAVIGALDAVDQWASRNTSEAADRLSAAIRVPAPIIAIALQRQSYGVARIGPAVVAGQQKVADAFAGLGLLPRSE